MMMSKAVTGPNCETWWLWLALRGKAAVVSEWKVVLLQDKCLWLLHSLLRLHPQASQVLSGVNGDFQCFLPWCCNIRHNKDFFSRLALPFSSAGQAGKTKKLQGQQRAVSERLLCPFPLAACIPKLTYDCNLYSPSLFALSPKLLYTYWVLISHLSSFPSQSDIPCLHVHNFPCQCECNLFQTIHWLGCQKSELELEKTLRLKVIKEQLQEWARPPSVDS